MISRDQQVQKDHYIKDQQGCGPEIQVDPPKLDLKLNSNLGHIIK